MWVVMRAPFEQLPFEDVPERPVRPHPFFEAAHERIFVPTRAFGELGVRVVRHGSGPPVVCIHGFMTTSYSFRYLLAPLGRTHSVVAFDLPGSGESDKPDARYGPDAMADTIVDVVGALGLRGAVALGNSLGGYLTMRAALRDPACFSRLVCLHAPGLPTARMRALRLVLDVLPRAHAVVGWLVGRDEERWVHRNVHYYDESLKSREEHREYAAPLRTAEGKAAFARALDQTLDVREMLAFERALRALDGAFPIPLQLVYARRDPMVPPSVGARLAALLPRAEMVWLDGASHFAHVDAPEELIRVALPFLQGGAAPGV